MLSKSRKPVQDPKLQPTLNPPSQICNWIKLSKTGNSFFLNQRRKRASSNISQPLISPLSSRETSPKSIQSNMKIKVVPSEWQRRNSATPDPKTSYDKKQRIRWKRSSLFDGQQIIESDWIKPEGHISHKEGKNAKQKTKKLGRTLSFQLNNRGEVNLAIFGQKITKVE